MDITCFTPIKDLQVLLHLPLMHTCMIRPQFETGLLQAFGEEHQGAAAGVAGAGLSVHQHKSPWGLGSILTAASPVFEPHLSGAARQTGCAG